MHLHFALRALVRLHDRAASTAPADEELSRFRQESEEALAQYPGEVSAYVGEALIVAEGARDEDWFGLCVWRSAIQILCDEYADTVAVSQIDPSEVEELDAELRRAGAALEDGPVSPSLVPHGIPETHWWWWYPKSEATHGPRLQPDDADLGALFAGATSYEILMADLATRPPRGECSSRAHRWTT